MPDSFLIVLTTLPTQAAGRKIAQKILKERLAACVNLLGPAESSFWWEGKIERAKEFLLLIKTRTSHFHRLRRFLEKNHPYSVPEIVALSIRQGNPAYLRWIRSSLS